VAAESLEVCGYGGGVTKLRMSAVAPLAELIVNLPALFVVFYASRCPVARRWFGDFSGSLPSSYNVSLHYCVAIEGGCACNG